MRTITLELLRHGVAHNQLLSPLTPYLALCENHAAVTLHVPFEHNQFLYRLRALGYKLQEESRLFQLQDTARTLSELLATIPGLTAESNKANGDADQFTHLRLIISASELALLPFELALSPSGLPGAGQHLLLQPQLPICLTREIRRVPGEQLQWPKKPRILFAAAAPPNVGAIPLEAHLLALRQAIRPWVWYYDPKDPAQRRKNVEDHLVFLPAASIEAIEAACATSSFTHVHILAHGVAQPVNFDTRFFLALHKAGSPDEVDYVSGARLATALRAAERAGGRSLTRPTVVTVASCDSGNQGSVAGAGSSIAHALHEAGIPLVIASQFPLSFEGSVRMVEVLYEGFLGGEDPRLLLHDLRRRLQAQFPETHDWASLTAYASLPTDIDRQFENVQIARTKHRMEAALDHVDKATRRTFAKHPGKSKVKLSSTLEPSTSDAETAKLLANGQEKIEQARRQFERLVQHVPSERTELLGVLASTEKRQAESEYSGTLLKGAAPSGIKRTQELLYQALEHYWQAFIQDQGRSWTLSSWTLVQYLSLAIILQTRPEGHQLEELWLFAHVMSRNELHSTNREHAIWAHGNLIELYLLAQMLQIEALQIKTVGIESSAEAAKRLALEHAGELLVSAGRNSFEVYSTRRQIFRYVEWFREIAPWVERLTGLAEEIFNKFPEVVEEESK